MAKRSLVLILMATGLMLAAQGADKRATQGDLVYLQNGSDVRISIETARATAGWTPVIVSVAGTDITVVMDSTGRVVQERAKGQDKRGLALFTVELEKGRILLGSEAHAVQVFEQDNVRTRFRIAEGVIQLPVRMAPTGKNGTLRFGNLEIPAQVSAVDRAVPGRAISQKGVKAGSEAINPAVLAGTRPAGPASTPLISRGFGAKAQLAPSRLRARAK